MKTINIRESLIEFDKQTDFKYSLTDLYEACRLDDKKKNQLVQYIDGKDVDGMSKMLSNEAGVMTENVSDDIADEDMPEDVQVESYLYFDDDYLSDAIDSTMHSGRLLQARWTNNHIVTYLRNDKYEVKHKVNGARVNVEFDTSDKTDSTLKFTVDGKSFVARYPNEAQDIIIRELENKNLKQFDLVVDSLDASSNEEELNEHWTDAYEKFNEVVDKVFPEYTKTGDLSIVNTAVEKIYREHEGEPDWDEAWKRWSECPDNELCERLLSEGPGAVLGDLAGKAVGDAWKGIKNFAKGVKDTAKDVAKTTKAVAKSASNDWKQSKTRAKVVDAARAIKDSNSVDEFKAKYNQRQADRKLSDKARTQSYKGKLGKTIGDVQDWKFEVGNKKMNFDQFMKLPVEQRANLIKNKKVKCFDLSGRETSFQDQAKRLSGLKEALLLEYSEYRRVLKEATAVMDRPRVSNVHTHRGSLSGIIDAHMDEINDMINANVPAAHIVHSMRAWIDEANLTKANARYAQNTLMRMAKMRSAEEVGMYLYNIRLKAEDDAYGSIDSQFYGKRYKYEDLNEALLSESVSISDMKDAIMNAYKSNRTMEKLIDKMIFQDYDTGDYDDPLSEVPDEVIRDAYDTIVVKKSSMNESVEEEDKPFTHSQIFDELKRETSNFSIGTDRGIYSFEKEVKMAEKILKKHYNDVKVTERGNDFMVEFSGPKNKKKKVNESVDSNFKSGDVVYVKPSKKLGRVVSVRGDYITVEIDGGNDPDRRDTFYPSDLELQDSVNESKSLTESKGRFELEVWVPGSGGDDDRERFIMASNNLQDIIDKAYEIDLDGDEAFYLRDMKDIYPYDLDQCYDAEELEDAIYNQWHYEPSADMRKQLGKMLLPKNEGVESSIEWEHKGKDGKIGRIRQSDGKGDRKPLTRDQAKEIAKFRGHEDDELYPIEEGLHLVTPEAHRAEALLHSFDMSGMKELEDKIAELTSHRKSLDLQSYEANKLATKINTLRGDLAKLERFIAENNLEARVDEYRKQYGYAPVKIRDFKNESKSMTESIFNSEVMEVIRDANDEAKRHGIDDEFSLEYYIGSAASAFGYPLESLHVFLPDHIHSEDKEYKDAVRGWKENEGINESLTEAMTYTDTDGFLGEPGETYTMSQFRRMWQDKYNDPVMSGYDSFEEWVGETISQMDAHEEEVAPSGRGMASCKIWKDTNGIMGNPGKEYTLNDLADYWTNNNGSDPVLAEYKGDWKAWLDATIPQMEERVDDSLYCEGLESKTFTDKEEAKKFAKDNKGAITSVVDDKLNPTHYVHYKGKEEPVEEAFEHPQNKEPHWYLCKHGIGPGALPKGVNIVDTVDDEENSSRVYVALDKVLTTDELEQYEVKEAKPPMKESLENNDYEIKNVKGHFEVYKDGKFVCSADTQKEAEDNIRELEGK